MKTCQNPNKSSKFWSWSILSKLSQNWRPLLLFNHMAGFFFKETLELQFKKRRLLRQKIWALPRSIDWRQKTGISDGCFTSEKQLRLLNRVFDSPLISLTKLCIGHFHSTVYIQVLNSGLAKSSLEISMGMSLKSVQNGRDSRNPV